MAIFDLIIAALKVLIIFMLVLGIVPVLIWMERKGAAYIQDRRGPNRASILGVRLGGVIHSFADAIKLLMKEEIAASPVSKPLFYLAPIIALFIASITVAVIPFAEPLNIFGYEFTLQIADLNAGLIYVFAMSSIGVYGLLIAGWSACGKYSLLGALRSAAQMISYEVALGLSVVAIFLLSGSLKLQDIVANQGALVWNWNVIRQPLAFVLFLVALFAETNRLPFDLPEGESEIVAGYHTEYSSMRFALFFMGEYAHIVVGSLIIATLFFGGWQFPFVDTSIIRTYADDIVRFGWPTGAILLFFFGWWLTSKFKRRYHDLRDYEPLVWGVPALIFAVILLVAWSGLFSGGYLNNLPEWLGPLVVFAIQLATLLLKALFFCAFFIWVRWTLPRFRYDQLMHLGWKVMVPLGVANIIITSAVLVFY